MPKGNTDGFIIEERGKLATSAFSGALLISEGFAWQISLSD